MNTGDYFTAQAEKKISRRRGHLPLTWQCNLRCRHCYPYLPRKRRFTSAQIKKKAALLKKKGILFLSLSGGEPLIRHDFLPLARHISSRFFGLALETNATLITPALSREMRSLSFLLIKVTLFSLNPDIHDRITGVQGSFKKSVYGLGLLKRSGFSLILRTTLMKENSDTSGALREYARKLGIGFESTPLQNITPFKRRKQRCRIEA
jgi:MoaA/NifB/PqqE/SkfB family radical SAM enzyme